MSAVKKFLLPSLAVAEAFYCDFDRDVEASTDRKKLLKSLLDQIFDEDEPRVNEALKKGDRTKASILASRMEQAVISAFIAEIRYSIRVVEPYRERLEKSKKALFILYDEKKSVFFPIRYWDQ